MDGMLTMRGRIGSDLTSLRSKSGTMGARFRLAVTQRRRTDSGEYEDLGSRWYSVCAWGRLANYAMASLHKGDPIFLQGRPSASAWVNNSGEIHSELNITAYIMGHDLNYGTTRYYKNGGEAPILPAVANEEPTDTHINPDVSDSDFMTPCTPDIQNATESQNIYDPGAFHETYETPQTDVTQSTHDEDLHMPNSTAKA